jgi:hypothetical protein
VVTTHGRAGWDDEQGLCEGNGYHDRGAPWLEQRYQDG